MSISSERPVGSSASEEMERARSMIALSFFSHEIRLTREAGGPLTTADQLPQDVWENSAVPVVVHLFGRIDSCQHAELIRRTVLPTRANRERRARRETRVETDNVECLESGETERMARVVVRELQWQHTHAD